MGALLILVTALILTRGRLKYSSARNLNMKIDDMPSQTLQDFAEPKDWLKSVLALLAMIGFLGTIYLLTMHDVNEGARDIVMVLTGVMAGIAKDVYSYFFGSSAKGNAT